MTIPFLTADLLRGIADHLWQSTVWVAAVAVLSRLTRQTHPRAQIWLWVTASLKLWVPFATLIALGSWVGGQASGPAALDATRVAPYVVVHGVAEPFSTVITSPDAGTSTAHDEAFPWITILGAVWASGVLVISGRWLWRWRRITCLAAGARVAVRGREVDAVARASAAMDWASPLRIALTTASIEPGVLGVARLTLLWPTGLSDHLDDEQLYAVMLHELSHARRRDNVIAAAHMVVEAAFWFYPVVWWVGSRLVAARELACDQEVVRLSRAPSAYAASLLKTCQYCLESPLDCVPGVTGAELKGRIEAIMHPRVLTRLTLGRKAVIIVVVALAIGTPIGAGAAKGPLTHVWGGALSLPDEPDRSEVAPPLPSPIKPPLAKELLTAAVPGSSPAREIDANPASFLVADTQSPSAGDAGQAQPVDAFRLGASNVESPRSTTPADPIRDQELEDALLAGQARTDLSLSITVNFRQLNLAEYLVPISVRIAPATELIVGRERTSRLHFLAVVEDVNGITYSRLRDAVDLTLGPASRSGHKAHHLRCGVYPVARGLHAQGAGARSNHRPDRRHRS